MKFELGNKTAPLWGIVFSPTEGEFSSPALFSQTHGQMLKQALGEAKNNVFLTCIRTSKGSTAQDIKERVAYLIAEAQRYQPNLVLLLGEEPLRLFEGRNPLMNWRGVPMASRSFPNKVLATISPEGCRRQNFVEKKSHPGQYLALFTFDVQRAVRESGTHKLELFQPAGKIITNAQEACDILEEIYQQKKPTAFDIEIIKPYSAHFMDCFSFSNSQDLGYCVVLGLPGSGMSTEDRAKVLLSLNKVLADPQVPKIAQNALFDMGILEVYYGIRTNNLIWDTMVAQQNIYCDLPKDLGTLTSLYTNLPYMKHLSGEDRYLYSAMDSVSTLHVAAGQKAEMQDSGILEHFQSVTMPSLNTIHRMHLTGVAVDLELMETMKAATDAQLTAIRGWFNKAMPFSVDKKDAFSRFNPGSPDQKKFLLHEGLGLPIVKNRDSVTVDKDYLEEMIKAKPGLPATICKLLLKYSLAQKIHGSMETNLVAGRMHTKYGIGGEDELDGGGEEMGTLTGRLNSKATDLWNSLDGKKFVPVGRNLQNLKKGLERQILIPDPGEIFVHCDLWAAEAFFVALDAAELEMLSMLARGIKLHNWMLDETTRVYPKEVESAGYDYKLAKQSVHSLNYAVEPPEMARNSGLPLTVCQWQYDMYHRKFPGIKERQARIKRRVYRERLATSPLGRQWRIIGPFENKKADPLKQAYAYGSQSGIGELTQIAASYLEAIGRHGKPFCFPAMNAHDGLAIRCKPEDKEAVIALTIQAFNISFEIKGVRITIPIEVGWGRSYQENIEQFVHFYNKEGVS
jgi:DNA polymerase I-like protein with 3'-5' exonuclease and polymerase domains